MTRRLALIRRSPFVRDLRSYGWLVGLLLAGAVCVLIPLLTRGQHLAWDGSHPIPTGGIR